MLSWDLPTNSSYRCPVFRGWVTDNALSGKFKKDLKDLSHIFYWAIQFIDNNLSAKALKNNKKRELKKKAFTNMDQQITSQSIQLLVDKRIVAKVKKVLNST